MRTIKERIEELRDRFANMFKQEAIRKNGTATKEYLDHLEAYVRVRVAEITTMAHILLAVKGAGDIVPIYMRRNE